MRILALVLVALCATAPARGEAGPGEDWHAVYDAYVAGANAVRLTAAFRLDANSYRVDVQARTLGVVDWFIGSRQSTLVEGTWHDAIPRPRQFDAEGVWKGERRLLRLGFQDGMPMLHALLPPETNREAIPAAARRDALDRLSPLALLSARIAQTGRCEASTTTYDGRRLEEITARTGAWEELPPSNVSVFTGRALRCEIELRQTAGFVPDEDRVHAGRLRHARIWLAQPMPGAPSLPVRISLEIGWLGSAMVHLSALRRGAL